ncbi:MAG: hypothetical protein GEV06_12370 [Luteitalea sp.]|nr:hypothetical protein [Luteitalea sp.]
MLDKLWTAWPRVRHLGERHLADHELLRITAAGQDTLPTPDAQDSERPDARSRAHLAVCDICRRRADQQQAALADLADAARGSLDELFSTSRLERQVTAVMRRLDGDQERGRLLLFPGRAAVRFRPALSSRRWIAAAAAAGLFLGLMTGQFVSLDRAAGPSVSRATATGVQAPAPAVPASRPLAPSVDDGEALLFEVDAALTSLGSPELRALDNLTPRVSATFASAQYQGSR